MRTMGIYTYISKEDYTRLREDVGMSSSPSRAYKGICIVAENYIEAIEQLPTHGKNWILVGIEHL